MISKSFHFAMLSHPGRVRKGNEDLCAALPESGAFVVCDGMGGAAAGEIASHLAAQVFLAALASQPPPPTPAPDLRLRAAIHAANQAVYQRSRTEAATAGMGTTLVALLLEGVAGKAPSLTLAHVGDSRCYLFRMGTLSRLTADHSLVEEQLRLGDITVAQAESHPMRNIITRAVGTAAQVEPEIRPLDPQPGDLYLLASDGLTRELSDAAIAHTLRKRTASLELSTLCQTLIDQANQAGGGDNITVLLLAIGPS